IREGGHGALGTGREGGWDQAGVGEQAQPTTPMFQGTNSWSPSPSSSLFVFSPEHTRSMWRKIFSPIDLTVSVPSRIAPQLMSMSSIMRSYMGVLVASLIDGAGFAPKHEPRPVVKRMTFAPPAICPV